MNNTQPQPQSLDYAFNLGMTKALLKQPINFNTNEQGFPATQWEDFLVRGFEAVGRAKYKLNKKKWKPKK